MVVFINLGLTSNCSWNPKCSLEAWSHVSHLLVIMPAGSLQCLFVEWLLEDRFLPVPSVSFHSLSWVSFQAGIVGGKSCRADLPCSLGDNNCWRVLLIEGKEISLNFSTCALPQLAGSQFWSRSSGGGLTSDVWQLICPARINASELDGKIIFCRALYAPVDWSRGTQLGPYCTCAAMYLIFLKSWGLWGIKRFIKSATFLIQCSGALVSPGPFRISLMAEKNMIIDTKTPESWHYFFPLNCGSAYHQHLKALETFEGSLPFTASNLCLWKW